MLLALMKNCVSNIDNNKEVLQLCRKLSTNATQKLTSFESTVSAEKSIAKKYLLLQDKSNVLPKLNVENVQKLLDLKINNLWKYSYGQHNCCLIQSNKEIDAKSIANRFGFDANSFPISTRMIQINSLPNKLLAEINSKNESNDNSIQVLNHKREDPLKAAALKRSFKTNQQLLDFLLNDNQLNQLTIKLRFFIILQLEELLCNGAFNQFRILPFGSSLAGLGNSDSDLDLVLLKEGSTPEKPLNFSCRELLLERSEIQRSLEVIADLIQHFVPNFSRVARILRARVPIIKFNFDLAPVDVDLSVEVSNNSAHHGFIMASYLSLCHDLHPCVRNLLLFIRIWAKQHGIVKSQAGNWFTNFQLTALALYFLQMKNIVPPISVMTKRKPLNYELFSGQIDLIELLREFFNFLLSFEYNSKGMSILNAKIVSKPDYSAIYIENPIELDLNICKNVVSSELEKLLTTAHFSLDIMNSDDFVLADILDSNLKELKKTSRVKAFKVKDLFNV